MVRQGDLFGDPGDGEAAAREQTRAGGRVRLNGFEHFIGRRPFLKEDLVRNCDLADIEQRRGEERRGEASLMVSSNCLSRPRTPDITAAARPTRQVCSRVAASRNLAAQASRSRISSCASSSSAVRWGTRSSSIKLCL